MEIIAGSRTSPVENLSTSRTIFLRYLEGLRSSDSTICAQALTDAQRWSDEYWRRRRGPISHGNSNIHAKLHDVSGPAVFDPIPYKGKKKRRRLPVASGHREKSRPYITPVYSLWSKTMGDIPLAGEIAGYEDHPRTIAYGVGSLEQFHECFHSWESPIDSKYPFMGAIARTEFTVYGYTHKEYTIPGWRDSGYYKGLSTIVLPVSLTSAQQGSRQVLRRLWPTRRVEPTQAQVEYARRMALASMYGGTPPSRPNFVRALIELKDTASTIRGLVHFFKWCKTLLVSGSVWARSGRTWKRLSGNQALRRSIGELAGCYLNYVFGIKPTADDIKLFLDAIRDPRVESLDAPQGTQAKPGLVITSHYQVRPERDALKMYGYHRTSSRRWIFTGSYHQDQITDSFGIDGITMNRSLINQYPELLETRLEGCVFARLKQENSEYFWRNFGHVGTTWSYPAIETFWEILPFSWLVDWFANTRQKIHLAEREARTYWMRVGFEPPWVAERRMVFRHLYDISTSSNCTTDLKARWYSYYAEQCFADILSTFSLDPGKAVPVACTFKRGPLEQGFPAGDFDGTPITVRTFQISVGMALVLNS